MAVLLIMLTIVDVVVYVPIEQFGGIGRSRTTGIDVTRAVTTAGERLLLGNTGGCTYIT